MLVRALPWLHPRRGQLPEFPVSPRDFPLLFFNLFLKLYGGRRRRDRSLQPSLHLLDNFLLLISGIDVRVLCIQDLEIPKEPRAKSRWLEKRKSYNTPQVTSPKS